MNIAEPDKEINNLSQSSTLINSISGPRGDAAGAPEKMAFSKNTAFKESSTFSKTKQVEVCGDQDEPADALGFSKDYLAVDLNVQLKAVQERYLLEPNLPWDMSLDTEAYSKTENLVAIQNLGQGNFGSVKRVQDSLTNRTLARKEIPKINYSWDELNVLRALHCDFIIKLFGIYYDGNDSFFLLLEDAGESLYQIVAKSSANKNYEQILESTKWPSIMSSILRALDYMIKKGYVHCDLKPENICVKGDETKLIDLGSCKRVNDTKDANCTLEYMSPEQLQCLKALDNEDWSVSPPSYGTYKPDHKTDMWAAFMVFLFIIKKDVPATLFRRKHKMEIEDLTDPIHPFFTNIDFPVWLKDLLAIGLKVEQNDRYSAEQCLVFLSQRGVLRYELNTPVCQESDSDPPRIKKRKEVILPQPEKGANPDVQKRLTRFTIVKIKDQPPSMPSVDVKQIQQGENETNN